MTETSVMCGTRLQRDRRLGEEGGGHDRERGVLGPMGFDRAGELMAAADAERGFEPIENVHTVPKVIRTDREANPSPGAEGSRLAGPKRRAWPWKEPKARSAPP